MKIFKGLIIFLVLNSLSFGMPKLPELEKFEKNTEKTMLFTSEKETVTIDVIRLMRKTIMIESKGNPKIKHSVAKGIAQIEPATFRGMNRDKNFRPVYKSIEKKYGVNLTKDWATDTYTNIVAGYAVYRWKMSDKPNWWDMRYKFKSLKNNYEDIEWNIYKIYYNSIKGKTTLKSWDKFSV
ncbi:MAG: hypothetical protein ACRCVS_02780 [Fusobacteriaceae bacterium]